jgi:cold shock CspA family protein
MSTQTESECARLIGQVKWFNNKAGYGFITINDVDDSSKSKDIFAHFSTIQVGDTQYKYLVQGEYVEFELSTSTNGTHEFQATKISGIKGGPLMCETRQTNRPVRTENRRVNSNSNTNNDGFQTVQKKRNALPKKNTSTTSVAK